MSNEIFDQETPRGQAELIDDLFAQSRIKIDEIIKLLAEKLSARIEALDLSPENVDTMSTYLDQLERIITARHMNMAKTSALKHFAPKKFNVLKNDHEIERELAPIRDAHRKDETNFPKRGPRGPREDVAPAPEEP